MTTCELLDYELESSQVGNEVCRCLLCGIDENSCQCASESSLPVAN